MSIEKGDNINFILIAMLNKIYVFIKLSNSDKPLLYICNLMTVRLQTNPFQIELYRQFGKCGGWIWKKNTKILSIF